MGVFKEKDHKGRTRYVVSKYWPEGSGRLRRYSPNFRAAKALLNRVESSIFDGTWRKLQRELEGQIENPSIKSFSECFIDGYCKPRIRSWKRYELSFKSINRNFGATSIKDFSRSDLHRYVRKRHGEVSKGTINRDIAAIKKMMSYAVECQIIEHSPIAGFARLRVPEKAFKPLSLEEYRTLVESMPDISLCAMVAVIGDIGLRKQEAVRLRREQIDFKKRLIIVEKTKNDKVRELPFSDYAAYWLKKLVRYLSIPQVFVNTRTGRPWVNPDKAFTRGCEKAGVNAGFHDL